MNIIPNISKVMYMSYIWIVDFKHQVVLTPCM